MEILPDLPMKTIEFETVIAFPMAEEKETGQPKQDVLTKSYFMEGNEELLLKALNISTTTMRPDPMTENVYRRIVCRYTCLHSQVKTMAQCFSSGLDKIVLMVKGTDTMLKATVKSGTSDSAKTFHSEKLSKAVSCDTLMKKIISGKKDNSYSKKFG